MHPDFTHLAEDALRMCREHFGDRCIAQYIHGSVARGDALPGVSDLDCMLVLMEAPAAQDGEWLHLQEDQLHGRYPVAEAVHLSVLSLDGLKSNDFARFALKYNARLMAGEDVILQLEASGISTPAPDAAFAKGRLGFARACFQQALDGKTPDNIGPLPEDPRYICRKFAQYFVIIEGAYYLMSRGLFHSFQDEDVGTQLVELCPEECQYALALTGILIHDPHWYASPDPAAYLAEITPLVEWMFTEIERA